MYKRERERGREKACILCVRMRMRARACSFTGACACVHVCCPPAPASLLHFCFDEEKKTKTYKKAAHSCLQSLFSIVVINQRQFGSFCRRRLLPLLFSRSSSSTCCSSKVDYECFMGIAIWRQWRRREAHLLLKAATGRWWRELWGGRVVCCSAAPLRRYGRR